LSDLVAEQTRDLVQAREVAEEASRAKSEFLATMSHELHTPLNGILGMTYLALGTQINERQRKFLEQVASSAQSLQETLDAMLDYVYSNEGKLQFLMNPINLPLLISEAVRLQHPRATDKGLRLHLALSPSFPGCVLGDAGRWRQLASILLDNAIKFTRQGEINVCLESRSENQTLYGLLSIQDTGVGIAAEQQERIFLPFTQADSSSTREFGGTGLGLALARSLVTRMQGTILLKSTPGAGSTFTVCVPLERSTLPVSDEPPVQKKRPVFDYLQALKDADPQGVLIVARQLLPEWTALFSAVRHALHTQNPDSLRELALELQGMFLSLGAMPAARLIVALVAQARSGNTSKALEKLVELERELSLFMPILQRHVQDIEFDMQ
jgi:hypothetical protein